MRAIERVVRGRAPAPDRPLYAVRPFGTTAADAQATDAAASGSGNLTTGYTRVRDTDGETFNRFST